MSETRFLNAADSIGARLCRDALWSGERCNWLGDAMEYIESRWQVVHRSFGPFLYDGTSGMGLFLARLFDRTHEEIFRKTAEGAMACALSQLGRFNTTENFGVYSGAIGVAFALAEAGKVIGNDRLRQMGLQLLRTMPRNVPERQTWDVISGSAGAIPALLNLHENYKEDFLQDLAVRHGDALLQNANRRDEGWSWTTMQGIGQKDLTGFSHGTAGIAWALLELYSQSGEQRFLDGAREALRYERRWYDPHQENWPDFRSSSDGGPQVCGVAWCHGAPGIGMARLRCYQILDDQECRNEAEAAIRTTTRSLIALESASEGNCSLCHGNFGNAELLILANDVLGDSAGMQVVHRLADKAVERYQKGRSSWPCGVLNAGESPNLMLGLAGIGYFYLRLHERKDLPSILLVR